MRNFPFTDIFFFIFPWNSLKIEYFVDLECISNCEFQNLSLDSQIKENKLEILNDRIEGQVQLTAKFSVLNDFKICNHTEPEVLKMFKQGLLDVEDILKGLRWNRGMSLAN